MTPGLLQQKSIKTIQTLNRKDLYLLIIVLITNLTVTIIIFQAKVATIKVRKPKSIITIK